MQLLKKGCVALRQGLFREHAATVRCLVSAGVLAALLVGCASDKQFETEILGHPAPEVPTDTNWPRTQSPPPPPPAYTPPPPAQSAPAPAYTPKPFKPSSQPATREPQRSQPQPAGNPAPAQAPAPAPAPAPQPAAAVASDMSVFTFQVGAYAHADKAKELMSTLEARGFSARMDKGTMNGRNYFRILAVKTGRRAELEGELLACGITEPRLMDERPAANAAGQDKATKPAAGVPAATNPKPGAKGQTKVKSAPAKPAATPSMAPPVVEPAPPLPDGYVPPPKSGN